MSVTRSIRVVQTDNSFFKRGLLCRSLPPMKHCETGQGKATMILPRYMCRNEASEKHERHTCEASEVHEIEDDNMSITCSISVAQTDN